MLHIVMDVLFYIFQCCGKTAFMWKKMLVKCWNFLFLIGDILKDEYYFCFVVIKNVIFLQLDTILLWD